MLESLSQLVAMTERLDTLEAAYADLKAKEEIRELFDRYNFSADCGDSKEYAETWAEDAVYDNVRGQLRSRETFFKAIEDPDDIHKRQVEGKGSLHTTGSLTIRVDGDRAWAEGSTLVWVHQDTDGVGLDAGSYGIFTLNYNHWDLRRNDGRWEIAKRISRPVAPGYASKVFIAWKSER